MNNKEVLYLAVGGIIGGLVGWFVTKTYYKKEAQEIRETYAEMEKNKKEEVKENVDEGPKEDVRNNLHEYAELLRSQGYTGSEKHLKNDNKSIYTIAPDEFGEDENYEALSFTYYNDGVLTDDGDDPVVNISEVVGDALNHIGEYEPDAVYVRNEKLKTEYEILRDERNYSDVEQEKPRPVDIKNEENE